MRLLYLAHKIRDARGIYWHNQNIRSAEGIAIELWRMGAAAICPGLNTYLMDGALGEDDNDIWMSGDFEIVSRCDGVVLSPNWEHSRGATAERDHALALNLPVFRWPQDRVQIHDFIMGHNPNKAVINPVAQRIVEHEKAILAGNED